MTEIRALHSVRPAPELTAAVHGGRILIDTPPPWHGPLEAELRDMIKALPGRRWHSDAQRWSIPATPAAALTLAENIPHGTRVSVTGDVRELAAEARRGLAARQHKAADELPDLPGATEGWLHQRQAFHFAAAQRACMLAMDMGTGKSKVFTGLCDEWEAMRVVVLAPVRAMRVWPFEFAKHSERPWIVVNHGGHRRDGRLREKPSMLQRTAAAAEALLAAERQGRPVCVVCNYEAAWQGELKKFFLAHEWDVLGLDESHKIKAPNGRWSRFAEALRRRADRAVAMTGTPMPHSPPDLYGQFRALDPGVLGTNYHAYLNRYFRMGGFEQRQVIGFASPAAEAEHTERFARLAYICSADDVLDLPPESDLPPVTFRLGADARRAYDQLNRDFVTLVAENFRTCEECSGRGEDCPRCRGAGAVAVNPSVVSAANALAQLIRLAQVTSGYLPVEGEDGELRHVRLGNEKQAALEELLESIGAHEKVVVFGRFHHDLDRIRETAAKLERPYGEISGRRADGLRPGRDDPRMNPNISVCGVQLQAGGVGIDLTEARYAIYYAMDFNLGDHLQSRKRVHRPGQERETFYLYLEAEGTVDEIVRQALTSRHGVISAVIAATKEAG